LSSNKHYLNQEQREAIALLLESPEIWDALGLVIQHHVAHQRNRLLAQRLDEGAEALAYQKARYEGAEWLATTVLSDLERIASTEKKQG
jgi:hypothetical protein